MGEGVHGKGHGSRDEVGATDESIETPNNVI